MMVCRNGWLRKLIKAFVPLTGRGFFCLPENAAFSKSSKTMDFI